VTEILSRRRLCRATLARQYLLERATVPAIDAIEHLAGMQSQAPLAPYIGLWTRLRDFDPHELSTLTERRQVVRLSLMRNTVHLVSARDALGWRALFQPLHTAQFTTRFGPGTATVDRPALMHQAGQLLRDKPRTRAELGTLLATHWTDADPTALGYAATVHLILCQVPPRGVWGKQGPAAWTPLETWLGAPLRTVGVDELVLRYLDAYGPATVADIQQWSGLTKLREIVERLPVRTFRTDTGRTLYDRPDAPRPPEDTPAPPRFLPAYDNLLLSHQDRTRIIPHDRPVPLPPGNGTTTGTFLIDGTWQGTWQVRQQTLRITPFTPLRPADQDALLAEAAKLAAFLAPPTPYEPILEQPT